MVSGKFEEHREGWTWLLWEGEKDWVERDLGLFEGPGVPAIIVHHAFQLFILGAHGSMDNSAISLVEFFRAQGRKHIFLYSLSS